VDFILLTTSLKAREYKLDIYTYNIEFAMVICSISRSSIERRVFSCYRLPGTMQIICHYIYEMQVPKITISYKEAADRCLNFLYLQCFFFYFISYIKTVHIIG